jgi:hypothetical protein
MAITFSKDISEDKLLMAYNNNVVQFSTNSVLVVLNCEVTGLGINAILYPHPNGSFYFNLLDYITAVINTKNFADDLVTDLDGDYANTFTYDVKVGCYKAGVITFKINFSNNTHESTSKSLAFLAGVFQLRDYKRQEINIDSEIIVLSPLADRTNNTTYLNYWKGYPFEFSLYVKEEDNFTLVNNEIDFEFERKSVITSLFLSDGRTDVTIENFLPLAFGMNTITVPGHDLNIMLKKEESRCGVYVKWLNDYGRYNYWLLHDISFEDLNTRYLSELSNDFNNTEDTISPTVQTGKTTNDTIRAMAKGLNDEEKRIVLGIFQSPKIYLFTGERFARSSPNDWVEVQLKNTNVRTFDPTKVKTNIAIDLELPTRYAQVL